MSSTEKYRDPEADGAAAARRFAAAGLADAVVASEASIPVSTGPAGPGPGDDVGALLLIVEDNATHRYILSSWLKRSGHTVLEAADGTDALTLLADRGREGLGLPELAIIDVHLPDMSGFEVCERIKAAPLTAGTPVIHVSATAVAPGDRTQGLDRGADAYLTEPIAPGELLATVAATLRYTRARIRAERLAERLGVLNEMTLEIYGASQAPALAAATARAAYLLFGATALVVTQSPHSDSVLLTSCPDGRTPVRRGAPAGLLGAMTPGELGNRIGVAIARAPGERWPEEIPAERSGGAFTMAAVRTKRARPPVLVALDKVCEADEDLKLLTQLAQACALALEALRSYAEEHALAVTLQRALLPARLPRAAGVELAVRYIPAAEEVEIGGDFYEAIETPAGLLLVVGDVAGHSMDAAVVMGGLRHALLAYVLDGHPPNAVLEKLDHLMYDVWPGWTATMCLALIAPDRRSVEFANAGHIPPMLLRADGACAQVGEHGPMLGADLPQPAPVRRELADGDGLLLVTDGLIEERGVDLLLSLERLRSAAEAAGPSPEGLCDRLLEEFRRPQEDDIVLLAARIGPVAAPGEPGSRGGRGPAGEER
ncbi:MAG TPA: SpoIIE family protein phosphatase [Actinocrinis sp.]|nr:SpoIIE family protein phosphatase [Actinocrinis sp.]